MRTHVEFRSNKFPAYEGEEEQVNPGIWGKKLAEYLSQKLQNYSIRTKEIDSEDWGWIVPIENEAFALWIGCANYQEYSDGYLVFIEPSKPSIRKNFFKKIDTTKDVARIADTLDKILTSDPDIHNLRWWAENEK